MNKKLYYAPEVCEINYRFDNMVMQEASGVFGPEQGIDMGGDETNKRTVTDADPNKRNAEWGDLW